MVQEEFHDYEEHYQGDVDASAMQEKRSMYLHMAQRTNDIIVQELTARVQAERPPDAKRLLRSEDSPLMKRQTPANRDKDTRMNRTNSGKKPYEAFDTTGKPSTCTEIRCVGQPSQSPQSRFFLGAVFSSDSENAFTLLYSFMAVEMKGQYLKDVRRAIQNGRCEFIQQYHEDAFLKPPKGAPIIESIRFITGDRLDDIVSTHQQGT